MIHNPLTVELGDRTQVSAKLSLPGQKPPRGLIQILHGMSEHSARYDYFIRQLISQDYAVVIHNHRGHGERQPLGYFTAPDHHGHCGWYWVVDDALRVQKAALRALSQQWPGTPLILFGHSMGSFVARDLARQCGDQLSALVLFGTNSQPVFTYQIARKLAETMMKFQPPEQPSKLLTWLVFGRFNARVHAPRTEFDWLTREADEVDRYIADPLCGTVPTLQFWYDLFEALIELEAPEALDQLPESLPVFMMSGDDDPVGRYGAGLQRFEHLLSETGHTRVSTWLYEARRHELLNEGNRDAVILDLLDWIEGVLN